LFSKTVREKSSVKAKQQEGVPTQAPPEKKVGEEKKTTSKKKKKTSVLCGSSAQGQTEKPVRETFQKTTEKKKRTARGKNGGRASNWLQKKKPKKGDGNAIHGKFQQREVERVSAETKRQN